MKELTREQCSQIAGGDPGMVLAGGGAFGGGGSGFGSGGINFGSSVGSGFDGIGPLSCSPAVSASGGMFGLSLMETLGAGTGLLALAGGLGQGYGASLAIEAAGGFGAIGDMGAAATGLYGSAALGVVSAGLSGYGIGTLAYNNIDFVHDGAQWAVENVLSGIDNAVYFRDWVAGVAAPYLLRYVGP